MQQTEKASQKVSDFKYTSSTPPNASQSSPSEEIVEINELRDKIRGASCPEVLREKALKMVSRLYRMAKFGSYSGEYELIDRYINWIIALPWAKFSTDNLNIKNAAKILDRNHYGLGSVKQRILEFLAIIKLNSFRQAEEGGREEHRSTLTRSGRRAPILCFVGIQGIGKTSMARSIADSLGRQFVRISLGAMGSVTDLKGQSRAFLDAEPGQIIKSLVRTKVSNPLILLDEIDKVSAAEGRRADINAALLEILDPEQNTTFIDSYIDYPVNLASVLFICTANTLATLSTALLDRLEIIRFPSYSDEEKTKIAKHYLLPKVIKDCGLKEGQVEIQESVWPLVIRPLGFDAGVRQLERNIGTICRRVAMQIIEGRQGKFLITPENFRNYLPMDIGVYS